MKSSNSKFNNRWIHWIEFNCLQESSIVKKEFFNIFQQFPIVIRKNSNKFSIVLDNERAIIYSKGTSNLNFKNFFRGGFNFNIQIHS